MRETLTETQQGLGRRLRQARLSCRLKQEEVARCLGLPVSAVSALENAKRRLDALELYRLARLYGKPMGWFFGESDAPSGSAPGGGRLSADMLALDGLLDDPVVADSLRLLARVSQPRRRAAAYGLMGFLGER